MGTEGHSFDLDVLHFQKFFTSRGFNVELPFFHQHSKLQNCTPSNKNQPTLTLIPNNGTWTTWCKYWLKTHPIPYFWKMYDP